MMPIHPPQTNIDVIEMETARCLRYPDTQGKHLASVSASLQPKVCRFMSEHSGYNRSDMNYEAL